MILNSGKRARLEALLADCDYLLVLPQGSRRFHSLVRAAFTARLGIRRGVIAEGEQAEELLELYSLYAFTDRLIVGSLDRPHGRKLRNLLDSGIATEEELINDVILGVMEP